METDLGEKVVGGDGDRSPTASLTECAQPNHSGMIYLFIFNNTLDKSFMIEKGSRSHLAGLAYVPLLCAVFVSISFDGSLVSGWLSLTKQSLN